MRKFTQNWLTNWGKKMNGHVPMLIAAVVFGSLGTLFLWNSHAATPTASLDAKDGTLSSCASKVTDTTASSGQAVKFGSGCGSGLDETGATIPDTNYAIPGGAIFMDNTGSDTNTGTQAAPVKTLNKAIS